MRAVAALMQIPGAGKLRSSPCHQQEWLEWFVY
jgi:hypothetical protein